MLKKFVVYCLSFIVLGLFASPAFAQNASPSSTLPLPPVVSPVSPLYTDLIVNNMFHTFSCLMVGGSVIGQPCLTYQVTKNAEGAIQSVPVLSQTNLSGGALGATTSLIGALYANPPLRTADYIGSLGEQLGFVKVAHAQVTGSGYEVLKPILTLWQVSRNISYLFMIIVFLIIGLMVLFRNRINPQTVITAQAALPGLVIGLILITFSYFLASLISDMSFVGTNIVGYYFSIAQGKPPQDLVANISSKSVLSIFTPFTKVVGKGDVDGALNSIWGDLADPTICRACPWDIDPQKALQMLTGFITSQLLSPLAGLGGGWTQIGAAIISATSGAAAPVQLASFTLSFIAMVILIYAMFRLLLRLVSAFLTIIFLTVTAPFQFLAASLPGRQGIATGWILNMLGNILIFPAVLAVLYFVAFILTPGNPINQHCVKPCTFDISQSNQTPNNNFGSTAYAQGTGGSTGIADNNAAFPLLGGFKLEFVYFLIAFGALVALPRIPDIVVSTVGRAGQAGQLIGQELGGNIAQGRQYAGQVQQGVGSIGQQVGRLPGEEGVQYIANPAMPSGYERISTKSLGQFERMQRGFRTARKRFGI